MKFVYLKDFLLPVQLMGLINFLPLLKEFPKDTITEEMVELMLPYMRMEDYNKASAVKVRHSPLSYIINKMLSLSTISNCMLSSGLVVRTLNSGL